MEITHITSIGNTLYSNLFILLIVTSFILLLAMVGSIVITVREKKLTQINFQPLTSNFLLPKNLKDFLAMLIILGLIGIMVKYPMLITTQQLNIP